MDAQVTRVVEWYSRHHVSVVEVDVSVVIKPTTQYLPREATARIKLDRSMWVFVDRLLLKSRGVVLPKELESHYPVRVQHETARIRFFLFRLHVLKYVDDVTSVPANPEVDDAGYWVSLTFTCRHGEARKERRGH